MPKPRTATPRKTLRLLLRAGFVVKRKKGSHIILKHIKTGKRIIVAMHPRDIPTGTLHDILKESGLR